MERNPDDPRGKRLGGVVVGAVLLVGAGAAVMVLTGDNGESDSGDGDMSDADAAYAYSQCMREEGIEDFPDPIVSDSGIEIENSDFAEAGGQEYETADAACQSLIDQASGNDDRPAPTPEEIGEAQDEQLAVAACMRENGYDYPDPDFGEGGSTNDASQAPGPEPGDPGFDQFEQDLETCTEQAESESGS